MNPTIRALVALCFYIVCLSSLAMVAGCDGDPNPSGDNGALADAGTTDNGRGGDLAGKPDSDSASADDGTPTPDSGDSTSNPETDASTQPDTAGCPAELLYTCADGITECITDLEKLWYARLVGRDCLNQNSDCSKALCYTKLDAVNSSSYVPDSGWEVVMKDGAKDMKYAGKRVLIWAKKGKHIITSISNEKLEMWAPQEKDPSGNFRRWKIAAELQVNGTVVVAVTRWLCEADGTTITEDGSPQKYDVK